jgi:hypothetical protein
MCHIVNFLLTLTGYEGEKRGERREKKKKRREEGKREREKKNVISSLYA